MTIAPLSVIALIWPCHSLKIVIFSVLPLDCGVFDLIVAVDRAFRGRATKVTKVTKVTKARGEKNFLAFVTFVALVTFVTLGFRQHYGKRGALADFTGKLDVAAMQLNHFFHESQA